MALNLVRITANSAEKLRTLERFDLDLKPHSARQDAPDRFTIPGALDDEQIASVRANGFEVEIVSNLSEVAEERLQEVSPTNRFADPASLMEFESRRILGYLTADEVESALMNLQTVHPTLVTLITLPNLTWEGRNSRAIRVRAGAGAARPGVLVTGGIHAREWGGSDICITFITNLIDAYVGGAGITYGGKSFTSAQVQAILEHLDLFVFPDVNPDGKSFSQTTNPGGGSQSTWWRKNRNPNTAAGGTALGVDLNRNFDFLWNSGIGTSSAASSFTYKGTGPFSEPETRNVRHLFDTFPNIRYFVDIHSFGELMLYSWGDDDDQTGNPAQNFLNPVFDGVRGTPGDGAYREFIPALDQNTAVALGNRMNAALSAVRGRAYTVQQAVGLYSTSAASDDYAFSRHISGALQGKIFSYTIEFGTEFVPPFAEMLNIISDVSSALTELCWAANSDVAVRDNPADTGAVPSAGPFWDCPDMWIRNAEDGGATHENTIRGRDNFVYVRVYNRGLADAKDVAVRVLLANYAGTQFVFPQDFVPQNPSGGGALAGPGTYLIGQTSIPTMAAGSSQIVHLRWNAALVPPDLHWHPCLLLEVAPDDGPRSTGPHVWESNNLGQKNLTIVDAARNQILELPFLIGSAYSNAKEVVIAVQAIRAPRSIKMYLDVQDQHLLDTLRPDLVRPLLPIRPQSEEPIPIGAAGPRGVHTMLLQPTTVAIPSPLRESPDQSLFVRMPANTRIEIRSATLEKLFESRDAGPKAQGFQLVTQDHRPMLAIVNSKEARLRAPKLSGERRPMTLRVVVPRDAAIGDQYEFQVVQYDLKGQALGGVILHVNVTR